MSPQDKVMPLRHPDRVFLGGEWVPPVSTAQIELLDPTDEPGYLTVPDAGQADMDRAVAAAREAFDRGPWPRMSHEERAGYLRAFAAELRRRSDDWAELRPRESGVLHAVSRGVGELGASGFEFYAGLAADFPIGGGGPR
ncbi:aldehyde dehydrogenase family protein [Amycolatopsis sp. NPDC005232]|uniref:aldehyde dehydrogenase family protein n=1 Tax=Amycolatopsis sp. NPDC005232 TaxID=3157027 RepID=UPI0033A7D9C7